MRYRRNKIEIIFDILFETLASFKLEEAITPVNKTRLMRMGYINHRQLKAYLKRLIRYGLLEDENNLYIITNKALYFLQDVSGNYPVIRQFGKITNQDLEVLFQVEE